MKRYQSAVQMNFNWLQIGLWFHESSKNQKGVVGLPTVSACVVLLSYLSVLIGSTTEAAPRTVTHFGEATNISSEAKTDFHIRINSDTSQNVTKAELRVSNGSPINGTVTDVAPDFREFTVDWDANIPSNAEVEWEVRFEQNEENAFDVAQAYFTPRLDPSLDLPLASWDIDYDGTVFLTNGGAAPIVFSNLSFQFPTDLSDSYLRLLLANPSSGVPGQISNGTVPAGGKLLVAIFPDLIAGDFLAARLDATSTLNASMVPQVLGHEHQAIPEPCTFLFSGIAVSIVALTRVRRVT